MKLSIFQITQNREWDVCEWAALQKIPLVKCGPQQAIQAGQG